MSIVEELEHVLRKEQEYLLAGEFDALSKLIEHKIDLADRLANQRPKPDADHYQILVQQAEHNEALLNSTRRGLQAAAMPLKLATEGTGQSTYSQTGKRNPLSKRPATIVQKS